MKNINHLCTSGVFIPDNENKEHPSILVVGNKFYSECDACGKLVCLNKTLFGSMHVCAEGK
jgi:hypothetical protein